MMNNPKVVPAVAYQGGKTRLASQIADIIGPLDGKPFLDLCCGGGSISLEMMNRGVSPSDITMVDKGPWGMFWERIGTGAFNMDSFEFYVGLIPSDPNYIKSFMEELSRQDPNIDTEEVFLILQAGAFGGKAIGIRDGEWANTSFRSFWQPTETSSRRSPVNPMMPMPSTLLKRVHSIAKLAFGVTGIHGDVEDVDWPANAVVYIDPPYEGTSAYSHGLSSSKWWDNHPPACRVFMSEGKPFGSNTTLLSSGRTKGGISGARNTPNQEWISCMEDE